ncbi:hypothetical protein OAE34_03075 [Akkermansiaceae bacterium]|nr:hypothetical protein [Akkermansiaceae bacterium]
MKQPLRDNIFTVGIIGLGQIGMGLDVEESESKDIFKSHIKSFYSSGGFELVFVLDKDKSKLQLAKERYKKIPSFYSDINEIEFYPEIIVLACNENVNLDLFYELKDVPGVKYFFVEKPFRLRDKKDYRTYKSKIIINYIRKFNPFYISLKKCIKKNLYGDLKSIDIKYSKGLDNTAPHFVDLLYYLFGNQIRFNDVILINKPLIIDSESSASFLIKDFINVNSYVSFHAIHDLYVIELDFIFKNKRIRIENYENEVRYYDIDKDVNFPEYLNFVETKKIVLNNKDYMSHVTSHLHQLCHGKIPNDFSIERDLDVVSAINNIKNKINE